MLAGPNGRRALVSLVLLVAISIAGVQFGPGLLSRFAGDASFLPVGSLDETEADAPVDSSVAVPATATASPRGGRQIVTVRRGPISELLGLSGRVAGLDEVALSFPTLARVETVSVAPGQAVETGQVLLEAESKEVAKQLEAARARVDVSTLRLTQAEAQAQARQREAERRADVERIRLQLAVTAAEGALVRTQATFER
jgi:multidrug efflux pump subunit AcrA (membrane-fusion protein)